MRSLQRMNRATLGVVAAASLSLYACGSADGGTWASPDALPDEAPSAAAAGDSEAFETLNELTGDDYALTFSLFGRNEALGDPGSIVISDGFETSDRLSALQKEHGLLTSLETFLAFAPEGQEPHPVLTAAHEDEARAFGRTDLTVLDLDARLIDKTVEQTFSCSTGVAYPAVSPLVYTSQESVESVTIPSTTVYLCSGSPLKQGVGTPTGCVRHRTTNYQVAVACRGSRGTEASTAFFFVNQIGSFQPEVLTRLTFTRLQIQPTATPAPVGKSLAVTVRNGASTESISFLYTGLAALL